jgi:Putative Ig domain
MLRGFLSALGARLVVLVLALAVPMGCLLSASGPASAVTVFGMPDATVAAPYDQPVPITVTGSEPNPVFTVVGALPPGLSLDSRTGHVIGTPTQAVISTFTVTFTSDTTPPIQKIVVLIVDKATQQVRFADPPPTDPVPGDTFKVRVVGTLLGGPVTVSIDPSSTPGACTLNTARGDVVTFTGPGVCVIAANQAGNANYLPAPTATMSIDVGAQRITFTSTAPANPVIGDTYRVTATGGGSGNPVTFSIDSTSTASACTVDSSGLVSFTGSGRCVIDADQAGNSNYLPASQIQQSMTVAKRIQTIVVQGLPQTAYVGQVAPYTLTYGGSGNTVRLGLTGPCHFVVPNSVGFTGVGTCTLVADQNGNAEYDPAHLELTITVQLMPQTI